MVEAIPRTCLFWDPGRTEVAGEAHQGLRLLVRLNRSPLLAAFRSAGASFVTQTHQTPGGSLKP